MKKVTTSQSIVTIHHYRNLLESEDIPCQVRNEILGGIAGEMPLTEVWPELWVINDIDYDRAKQLIDDDIVAESPSEPWTCARCGEKNEGQFAACWKCGKVQ